MAEHKISNVKAGMMISIALVIDGIQALVSLLHFIPLLGNIAAIVLNTVISVTAYASFTLWFALNGIHIFKKPRGVAVTVTTMILEAIPFIKMLPGLSFWVWRIIVISRVKEKTPQKKNFAKRQLARRLQQRRQQREAEAV